MYNGTFSKAVTERHGVQEPSGTPRRVDWDPLPYCFWIGPSGLLQ